MKFELETVAVSETVHTAFWEKKTRNTHTKKTGFSREFDSWSHYVVALWLPIGHFLTGQSPIAFLPSVRVVHTPPGK